MHESLAQQLRNDGCNAQYVGGPAFVELKGTKRVRRVFIDHEAPVALVYPATLQSREIMWFLMQMGKGTLPKIDCIIRAHTHRWQHLDHDSIHAISLPCLCGLPIYKGTRRYFPKLIPDIGAVLLFVDKEGRMRYMHFIMPPAEVQKIVKLSLRRFNVSREKWLKNTKELEGFR